MDGRSSDKCASALLAYDVTFHAKLVKSLPHGYAADLKCGNKSYFRWNNIADGKFAELNSIQWEILDLLV
jgi:hypothetical protein